MKNKNNVTNNTATNLVDLICQVRKEKHNDSGTAYAYAVGTLQAIIDNALYSSDKDYLQNSINNSFEHFTKELGA